MKLIREIMYPRLIVYAIIGGLCVYIGIGMLLRGDLICGVILLIIGIINAIELFRLVSKENKKNNIHQFK